MGTMSDELISYFCSTATQQERRHVLARILDACTAQEIRFVQACIAQRVAASVTPRAVISSSSPLSVSSRPVSMLLSGKATDAIPISNHGVSMVYGLPPLPHATTNTIDMHITSPISLDPFVDLADEILLHIVSFITDSTSLVGCAQLDRRWYRLMRDNSLWRAACLRSRFVPLIPLVVPGDVSKFSVRVLSLSPERESYRNSNRTGVSSSSSARTRRSNSVPSRLSSSSSQHRSRDALPAPTVSDPGLHPYQVQTSTHLHEQDGGVAVSHHTELSRTRTNGPLSATTMVTGASPSSSSSSMRHQIRHARSPRSRLLSTRDTRSSPSHHHHHHNHHNHTQPTCRSCTHNTRAPPIYKSPSIAPWKHVFKENYMTWLNWMKGTCTVYPIRHERSGNIYLDFDDSRAVSVRAGERTNLWNIETGQSQVQIDGHDGTVSAVKFDHQYIVTGGSDAVVKVWDASTGVLIRTLVGHSDEIGCLQYGDGIVVSGSEDKTARIWNIFDGNCLHVLRGHTGAVCSLHFHETTLATGSADATIRVWSMSTGKCIHTLTSHTGNVYTVHLNTRYICSGGEDTSIKMWDVCSGQLVRTLQGHHLAVVCLQFDEHKIVSGSADKTIKVWSLKTGHNLYTLKMHTSGLWNLRFTHTKLISSSFDESLLVWNFANPIDDDDDDDDDGYDEDDEDDGGIEEIEVDSEHERDGDVVMIRT